MVLVSVGVTGIGGLKIRATLVRHLCHYLVLPGHIRVGGDDVTLGCYDHTALTFVSLCLFLCLFLSLSLSSYRKSGHAEFQPSF